MAVPQGFKTVTCYLPPDIASDLEKYCLDNQITRKGKQGELSPGWGTGIVEILKIFFNSDTLPSPLPSALPDNGLSKVLIESLVKDLVKDYSPNQTDWDKAIADSPAIDALRERIKRLENQSS